MTREQQKRVTDHYRSAWDQIFGTTQGTCEPKPVDTDDKEQYTVDTDPGSSC